MLKKGANALTVIENANIVLETEILCDGVILVDGERIAAVGKRGEIAIPADAERIDAEGAYVGPGFVDIHVHGGDGALLCDEPERISAHFLRHGETTVLAALYYNMSREEFLAASHRVRSGMETAGNLRGLYMEGPYMNPEFGAMAEKNLWKGPICREDYLPILDAAADLAKVWVIAPEREGIEGFLQDVKEKAPDAVISMGHSRAVPDEAQRLKKYGLRLLTHCMDATGRQSRWRGTRGAGPDEACLMDDDMYAEVIADSGAVHVNRDLLRLILKVKGADKVVLITDSNVTDAESPPHLQKYADLVFDDNGDLAGSRLTMDAACGNMLRHTGCSMPEVFLMASRNPARIIGLDGEIGTVENGKFADLVFVDAEFCVKNVMLRGILQK